MSCKYIVGKKMLNDFLIGKKGWILFAIIVFLKLNVYFYKCGEGIYYITMKSLVQIHEFVF